MISFRNPDACIAARWDCGLLEGLHSGEGLRKQAEDSRIVHSSLACPWLLRRAGQEGDRAGVSVRLLGELHGGPQILINIIQVAVHVYACEFVCVYVCLCVCVAAPPHSQCLSLGFHLPQEPPGTPRTSTFF